MTDVDDAPRLGRRRTTTRDHIADVALELFCVNGFGAVSVDDIALSAGISRRTLFRYYASKSAIPWGDFEVYLGHFAEVFECTDPAVPMRAALRAALLDFNTYDEVQNAGHRRRMAVILQTPELQAYSMTMYAGWRAVVAGFVARRTGAAATDLVPQTTAWLLLGVSLSAYEYWLSHDGVVLRDALAQAFDAVAAGLP